MIRGIVVCLSFIAASVSFYQSRNCGAGSSQQQIETVQLCQAVKDWKKYDHKTVRIEAIYAAGFERSELYDLNCLSPQETAWVELAANVQKASASEVMNDLNQLLRSDGRARITAVGEFDGPKKVDIPPNTPESVAQLMRAVNSRYGHMNHWNFQFVLSKIERAEAVPKNASWPRADSDEPR